MSYASLLHKTDFTTKIAASYFQKYNHLLKWKNYKEDVLEVGCADGSITRDIIFPHVKDYTGKYLAIDKSEEMIKFARESDQSFNNIDYQVMDAMDPVQVEKKKGHFDHIFSLLVAHWIPDNRTFVNGFRKMLKPNGQIFMTIMVDTPMQQTFYKHASTGTWSQYVPNENIFAEYTDNPSKYFRNFVTDIGFKVELCESEKSSAVIEEFPDFLKVILSFYKYLNRIPPHLQEAYFQDHLRSCYEQGTYLGGKDNLDMPYETMICIASKAT